MVAGDRCARRNSDQNYFLTNRDKTPFSHAFFEAIQKIILITNHHFGDQNFLHNKTPQTTVPQRLLTILKMIVLRSRWHAGS
jgi:hypothetical protein